MTSDEAFTRIVRGHPWIITICIALPLLVVVVLQVGKQPAYGSATRVQVATQLAGSTVEADAASTRAVAVVTSPSVVTQALATAGLTEDPTKFVAQHVVVNRIGVSPIVDVLVTTDNAQNSTKIAASLGSQLVDILNQEAQASSQEALTLVESEISTVQAQRNAVATKLLALPAGTTAPALTAQLASLDSQLAALNTQHNTLAVDAAAPPLARTIDPATTPDAADPTGLVQRLGLGLLLGVLLALAVAGLVESLRPKASSRAAADRLEAPYLGDLGSHASTPLVPIHRRLAELAREAGVTSFVLTPVGRANPAQAAEATHLLASALQAEVEKGTSAVAGNRVLVMPLGDGAETEATDSALDAELEWRPVDTADLGATTDPQSGFVVLVAGRTRVSDLRSVQAQIRASGRPLLAVVGIRGHLRASSSPNPLGAGTPDQPKVSPPGTRGPGTPPASQGRPEMTTPAAGTPSPAGRNHIGSTNGTTRAGHATKTSAPSSQPIPTRGPAGNRQEPRRG